VQPDRQPLRPTPADQSFPASDELRREVLCFWYYAFSSRGPASAALEMQSAFQHHNRRISQSVPRSETARELYAESLKLR
jgi:hypothetical protein